MGDEDEDRDFMTMKVSCHCIKIIKIFNDNVSRSMVNLHSGEKPTALEAQLNISSKQSRSLESAFYAVRHYHHDIRAGQRCRFCN